MADPSTQDRELFGALAAGGKRAEQALKRLYDTYARRLLGLLRSKGYTMDEAEEIVQESFLKLFQSSAKLAEVDLPKAYLYRVVMNCATDYLRTKRKADPEIGVDPEELAQASDASSDTSDSQYDGFMDCFEAAFSQFEAAAPDRAVVIRLAVIEGMSGHELAEAIGRSYGAAREFLSQTRKRFQDLLTDKCGDYLPAAAS